MRLPVSGGRAQHGDRSARKLAEVGVAPALSALTTLPVLVAEGLPFV